MVKINTCDNWRPIVNYKFDSVWSIHLDTAQRTLAMEEQMDNYEFGLNDANVKIMKTYDKATKSNKYNQCDFNLSQVGNLRRHLKTNKGDHCDFASI